MLKALYVSALCVAACAVSAEPVTFAIDPGHTVVTFEALHLGTSTQRGRLVAKEGSVVLDRAAKTGKADITLDMNSISTASTGLTGFLRGERAFNVAANPTARLVVDSMTFDGDKVASIAGTLTLNGKSQPMTLRAKRFNCYENAQLKREVCGGDFEGTLLRSQYGLGFLAQVTPDEIPLLVQVEGVRQQ
ncbi:YceI family protein [Piscinibacter koreensis]|uniref:YceI family protein n=1 Tax=Piscinibacter koreensis TaxID=2742824 RepID=A0A7Y6TWY5_9BURK|nr:YceI family protein [Schlegelella koreensis]NUZ06560.1 YceI family protein [Schlegelella koreensis]